VANGRDALEFLAKSPVDLILMDLDMPEMDGLEATRRIMETRPLPIVICSAATDPHETATTFRSLEVGAVACVQKPVGKEHTDYAKAAACLLETVKLMAEVKVVRRWPRMRRGVARPSAPAPPLRRLTAVVQMIGIGASTGGPPVLQTILAGLPQDFSVPVLVVQHIASGFITGLVDWLSQTTGRAVHLAAHGSQPLPGHVYLAPDDFHMRVGLDRRIALTREPLDHGMRPSVDRLFHSLAEVYAAGAVGVLLTGMGTDGALELANLKERGACTIAQDRESSVVHGMPGQAIALGAARWILPADGIAAMLAELAAEPRVLGECHDYVESNA
jgi:two-component system chemotaxis response regulator CheB